MSRDGRTMGLEGQLRQAIVESDLGRRRLAVRAGVHRWQVAWFMQGKRSLAL